MYCAECNQLYLRWVENPLSIPRAAAYRLHLAQCRVFKEAVRHEYERGRIDPGSDQAASIEPDEFTKLVTDIKRVEDALGDGIKRVQERGRVG